MDTSKFPLVKGVDTHNVAMMTVIQKKAIPLCDKGTEGNNASDRDQKNFYENDNAIWTNDRRKMTNFKMKILAEKIWMDGDQIVDRCFLMELTKDGNPKHFDLTVREFIGKGLIRRIYEVQGGDAIINGTDKELRLAIQELSPVNRPIKVCHTTNGFTMDAKRFLTAPAIEISGQGIAILDNEEIDLSNGTYSRRIRYEISGHQQQIELARHILKDFLELKNHRVTFPLIAHIALAPFSSRISLITDKQRSALHLQGPSGVGKTVLATTAVSFFGDFEGHLPSWSSTANAIEALGYEAKDALFVLDDLKPGIIAQADVLRVFQNHANGHGRARLKANGKLADTPHIRGLLLSTGESFVVGVESVASRTILIDVESEKNTEAGKACFRRRAEYPVFLPGLIQHVLAQADWEESFRDFVETGTRYYLESLPSFPNGLRIASNWALNSAGFIFFLNYIRRLKVISEAEFDEMAAEYLEIACSHIKAYAQRVSSMNPTEVFRRIMCQKLATGIVSIAGLEVDGNEIMGDKMGNSGSEKKASARYKESKKVKQRIDPRGRCIGKASGKSIYFFPDAVIEVLSRHYAARKTSLPFTEEALKKSLNREGYLEHTKSGRLTTQVRLRGVRAPAWKVSREVLEIDQPSENEHRSYLSTRPLI